MGCKEYRWVGRQTDKVPRERGKGGLGREDGTRAQTTQPLSYIPCPARVRENTSSVSWVGKWLFQKIISYKASKNLRENLSKSSLLSNIWHQQWGWHGCLRPWLSHCCGLAWPTPGAAPWSLLLPKRGVSRRQGSVGGLRGAPGSLSGSSSLW